MSDERNDLSHCGFMFLRHGETLANHLQIACGGDREMEIMDSGRQQVKSAATVMRSFDYIPQLIITGSLQRTVESARIVQSVLNPIAEILIDPDLNERFLGDWNGQSHSIINPLMLAGEEPNNGESRAEFRTRLMGSFDRLRKHFTEWPLIIGSRGTARILLEAVQDPGATNFPNGKLLRVHLIETGCFEVKRIERLEPSRNQIGSKLSSATRIE